MLATTYRPQNFSDMIGQDVLVKTITNAILQNRIANAFLLTGIRGVGKTTTARIIAKALNCTKNTTPIEHNSEASSDISIIEPCGQCSNCIAISQSRHPDVLEVDAASRTGVDDIRDIIENTSYMPSSAHYKIYIIDEVHMLSKSAFNALLKTLEEPPAHVKFIFATTEVRKIPVTILSRCQRFDLKRIGLEMLTEHLGRIAEKENVKIEPDALILIAKAAEGSVRDALSLLDQAIVHSEGIITATLVSDMMGLSDRHQLMDLFDHIAHGNITEALDLFGQLYHKGMDVIRYFQDLLELLHLISKAKVTKQTTAPGTLSQDQWERIVGFAESLELSYLTRSWQMTLNGLDEISKAPIDVIAGEMLLIKLMYMSQLPSPSQVIRQLQSGSNHPESSPATPTQAESSSTTYTSTRPSLHPTQSAAPAYAEPAPAIQPDTSSLPETYAALVELFKINHEPLLYSWLYNEVCLVKYQKGTLEIRLPDTLPANFTQRVTQCLNQWTGARWMVAISQQKGLPPLAKQQALALEAQKEHYSNHPEIKRILELFPGSKVIDVKDKD